MFYYYLFFLFANEINSFIETNYGNHNFIHITKKNKFAYRACGARGGGRVALAALAALVVTCCVVLCHAFAVQHAPQNTCDFFLYQYNRLGIRNYHRGPTEFYSNDLHEALINKKGSTFWKCWNAKFESCSSRIQLVDGTADSQQIAEKFDKYFSEACSIQSQEGADS